MFFWILRYKLETFWKFTPFFSFKFLISELHWNALQNFMRFMIKATGPLIHLIFRVVLPRDPKMYLCEY